MKVRGNNKVIEKPLFSIIFITYNAERKIGPTIDSVLKQTVSNYECIFIDGNSTDKTTCVIQSYCEAFLHKGIGCVCVSEIDDGIYDAMNKGIFLAKGEWIYFLNAGDFLYDESTLERVKNYIADENVGVVYGDTEIYKRNGLSIIEKARGVNSILGELPFCHQSSFTKRELLLCHPFVKKYRICADYEFFLWCYKNGVSFKYLDLVLSKYEYGGISSCEESEIQLMSERIMIQMNNDILGINDYQIRLGELERYRKYKAFTSRIKRIIPDALLDKRIYILDLMHGWSAKKENHTC